MSAEIKHRLNYERKKRIKQKRQIQTAFVSLFVVAIGYVAVTTFSENPNSNMVNEKTTLSIAQDSSSETETTIDFSAVVPAKSKNAIMTNMGDLCLSSPYTTDRGKLDAAEEVLRGTVVSTQTVLDGSTVFTKSQVKVEESYKGNVKVGSVITVKELGGFISENEYNDAISMEKFGVQAEQSEDNEILDVRVNGFKVMEKDESVILFLVSVNNSTLDEFKGVCYEPLRVWQGKLLFNEKTKKYTPYVPKEEAEIVAKDYSEEAFMLFAKQS